MPNSHDFTTRDVEYLRLGDRPMLATIYRPKGTGPFPAVIDLHGGAWTVGDRTECAPRAEALARTGLVVVAIDFRHAADGYPSSLVDINYAIRWVKAHADELATRPDLIGLSGQSSGGHLAMLAAMRPADPRYAAIPLPAGLPDADATVACLAMSWPVINPLSRYRHALRLRGGEAPPAWTRDIPERHILYWGDEAAMGEGNPVLALEGGEAVLMPPALWVQGRPDPIHDYVDPEQPVRAMGPDTPFPLKEPERFAASYREAGGEIEVVYIDNAVRASAASFDPVAAFFHARMPVAVPA